MLDRRECLAGGLAIAAVGVSASAVLATPEQVADQVARLYGDRPISEGKIKLDLPALAENGLVVPLGFAIDSPMTESDYVKSVTFFAPGNPNPIVAAFHFTPLIPKAAGQLRIRLGQTQSILAIAEMSDGRLFMAKQEIKVTIGGCGG